MVTRKRVYAKRTINASWGGMQRMRGGGEDFATKNKTGGACPAANDPPRTYGCKKAYRFGG